MVYQKKWFWFFLFLGLFALACGFGGRAREAINETQATTEAAVQEVVKEAESAVAETAKEGEQVKEAAAEEAVKMAEETEEAELQVESIRSTLQNLSSYRWQFSLAFEGVDSQGQAEQGQVNMLIEGIKDPAAVHVRMQVEGQPAEESGGPVVIEIYNVDNVAYMQNPEDGSWFSFPSEGGMADFFDAGFFNPDEILELPENARRSVLPEEVNGISTWHYTFDETDVNDKDFNLDEAKGDIWIARDGGYPVKLILEARGTNTAAAAGDELFATGSFKMTYELLDVNAEFTIEVPEEALAAGGLAGDSLDLTDLAEIDLPLMADAEIEFAMEGLVSYTVQANVAAVVEFYRTELPGQGWTLQPDSEFISEETALLTFSKDDAELSLVVSTEADGSTSVVLSTEER